VPCRFSLIVIAKYSDLQLVFELCQKLLKRQRGLGLLGVVAAWKDAGKVEAEIMRIEKRIDRCFRTFSVRGLVVNSCLHSIRAVFQTKTTVHTELAILEFREEMRTRLDHVDLVLQQRLIDAETNSSKAQALVGSEHMSPPQMNQAIRRASMVRR
jgi:hypothetical protein